MTQGHPSNPKVNCGLASNSSFLAFSSSISQFAQMNFPFKKSASGLVAHTINEAGNSTAFYISFLSSFFPCSFLEIRAGEGVGKLTIVKLQRKGAFRKILRSFLTHARGHEPWMNEHDPKIRILVGKILKKFHGC